MSFILGVQGWFSIWKAINIIHYLYTSSQCVRSLLFCFYFCLFSQKPLLYSVTYWNWYLFFLLTQDFSHHHLNLTTHTCPPLAPASLMLVCQTPNSRLYPPPFPSSPTQTSISISFPHKHPLAAHSQLTYSPSHLVQSFGFQQVSPIPPAPSGEPSPDKPGPPHGDGAFRHRPLLALMAERPWWARFFLVDPSFFLYLPVLGSPNKRPRADTFLPTNPQEPSITLIPHWAPSHSLFLKYLPLWIPKFPQSL